MQSGSVQKFGGNMKAKQCIEWHGRDKSLLYEQNHYKTHNSPTLTNGINPFKIDMENIQHTYDLHIVFRNEIPR